MKLIKYFLSAILIVTAIWSCTDEDFGNLNFLSTATAPTNVAALFNVTQDNTGTVTITPNSEGAVSYDIFYGDNTASPGNVKQGKNIVHVYSEGTYTVKLVAIGITGLKTEMTLDLVVSFKAPENLVVVIQNDLAISKKVNVTATADFAMLFDVYFGEVGSDEPVLANNGGTASYVYKEAGTYTIRVVSKSAAIQTTEYIEEFVVTAILQPLASAPTQISRATSDVISIYSSKYDDVADSNYNPDWGQSGQGSSYAEFDLNGDKMLNYINLSYQGIDLGSAIDASSMEFLHIDIWTADDMSIDIYPLPNGVVAADERFVTKTLVANQWNSFNISLSDFTSQGLPLGDLKQFKFVGAPWAAGTVFIDNIYFYKAPEPASGLEGIWKLAPEAGALKVGPSYGSGDWWSSDAQAVIDRACLFDDTYVFSLDGSFSNVLGNATFLEAWQGMTPDGCGTPVAPHNGSTAATYIYDATAGTITINGAGAYLGIPKANNAGELPNVAVPSSIVYDVVLSDNNNTMTIVIEAGSGVFWSYKLVRYISPIVGTWKLAPEAGALKVGDSYGAGNWWTSDAQAVIDRACLFDDTYVFSSNGSFSNVLGTATFLEAWQGMTPDGCGMPVAPHDGTGTATYSYDETTGTVTLNGEGAYLGIPKANNTGELPNVSVPSSIVYDVVLSDNNTMTIVIEAGSGVFWSFKLVKN